MKVNDKVVYAWANYLVVTKIEKIRGNGEEYKVEGLNGWYGKDTFKQLPVDFETGMYIKL